MDTNNISLMPGTVLTVEVAFQLILRDSGDSTGVKVNFYTGDAIVYIGRVKPGVIRIHHVRTKLAILVNYDFIMGWCYLAPIPISAVCFDELAGT